MLNKSLRILPEKNKVRFIKSILMSVFASILELVSLGLIIPIIYSIINPKNEILNRLNEFFKKISFEIDSTEILNILILSLVVIFIIKTLYLSFFTKYILVFKRNLRNNLAQKLYEKYLKLQYVKAVKQGFAEMQKNIDSETQRYSELILSYIMLINEFIMAISIIIFLLIFNFKVTLFIASIFLTIFFILVFALKNRFKFWGIKSQEAYANYNNTLLQSFNNLREIKLQGKEDFFIKMFSSENKLKNYYQFNHRLFSTIPKYFIELCAVILIFLILFIMIKDDNNLDYLIATLGVFAYASIKLLPNLNKLINLVGEIRFRTYSSDLISKELKSLNEDSNLNSRKVFQINNVEKIELSNIGFSYKKEILKNLSLMIKKGSLTGIYGPSGAGKTTLLDIISSLIIPNEGKILINDKEIDPKVFFWGKSIGYISQSSDLLNETIRNNIAIGNLPENIDEEKIKYAVKASNLEKFINELPNGINTVVGEKGSQISSGQKQRINIARAFYNNSKVLIMDESTNSLDSENEKNIFSDIKKMSKNLIVLVVSHDKQLLSTYCDDIFVLESYKLKKIN